MTSIDCPLPAVAVTQRVDVYPARGERRDAIDQRLIGFLLAAGFLPVPMPNLLLEESVSEPGGDQVAAWMARIRPCAVLLSGGNDIGSCVERERTERSLLSYAEHKGLAVLGLCRGMQQLGVRWGAKLKKVAGHTNKRHRLRGEFSFEVNSYHEFSLDTCPNGFVVTAVAEDGEIEAIRHEKKPWEGWMWHPEREADFRPAELARVRTLFCSSRLRGFEE